MAHDFLGNELSIGDDVVFLNYNVTSASLERGIITRVSEHTAEISGKRRAEYKIIKVNPVKPTMDTRSLSAATTVESIPLGHVGIAKNGTEMKAGATNTPISSIPMVERVIPGNLPVGRCTMKTISALILRQCRVFQKDNGLRSQHLTRLLLNIY